MSTPVSADSPLSGFNPAKIEDGAVNTSVNVSSFWADNAFTLQSIVSDNWGGSSYTPQNVNNADAYWYADAGFTYKGWRFAGFNRGELFIETNRDTVDIIRMLEAKQELPVGNTFAIDLKSDGFSATGAELSRMIDLNSFVKGLNAGLTMRYLRADMVQYGKINGPLTPTGPKTYNFTFVVDYIYDKNLLYKRKNASPESGNGYSFDIGAVYNWNNKLEASFLVRDLLGSIYWKNVPYTTAEANSDVRYINSDGYQSFRPTIKGYEGYKSFTQKIPLKTDLDIVYSAGPVKLSSTINFIEDRPFYWFNIKYVPTSPLTLSTGYNTNFNVYSIGVDYKLFQLKAYSDSFNFERAKALGVILSFGHSW